MYKKLVKEMRSKRVSQKMIADHFDTSQQWVSKLIREERFSLAQAFALRDAFFPDKGIEELFQMEHKGWRVRGAAFYEKERLSEYEKHW